VAPDVDESCLAGYLAHRVGPDPRTLYQGIRQLPQAHRLRLTHMGPA
jgi:hypothetical protein